VDFWEALEKRSNRAFFYAQNYKSMLLGLHSKVGLLQVE